MENLFLFFFFQNSLLHFCCTLSLCDYLLRETAQTPCRQTREELSLNLLALVSAKDKSRKKGGGEGGRNAWGDLTIVVEEDEENSVALAAEFLCFSLPKGIGRP